jgi:hypothetical protein
MDAVPNAATAAMMLPIFAIASLVEFVSAMPPLSSHRFGQDDHRAEIASRGNNDRKFGPNDLTQLSNDRLSGDSIAAVQPAICLKFVTANSATIY